MKGVGMHCRIKKKFETNTRVKESYYGMVCMFFHHTSELKPVCFFNYLFLIVHLSISHHFLCDFSATQTFSLNFSTHKTHLIPTHTHYSFTVFIYPFLFLFVPFGVFILFLFSLRRKFFFSFFKVFSSSFWFFDFFSLILRKFSFSLVQLLFHTK